MLILALGGIVASDGTAMAARVRRCVGEPFSFSALQTTQFVRGRARARVGWEAAGSTVLACPDGVLSIDVWEHAVVGVARNRAGARVVGDATARVSIPDGGTLVLGGLMQGGGPCAGGVCRVEGEVRARGSAGETLRLLQAVTVDFLAGEVTDVEVLHIVIEFTGAG